MEYLFKGISNFLLLYVFRASPQPSQLPAVNVSGFQIWPQAFQEGHPQKEYYTHLTLNATVKLKKKANTILRMLGKGESVPVPGPCVHHLF